MSKYLFIESRDPFETPDVKQTLELATELAKKGNAVTTFLVQNGVLAARKAARVPALDATSEVTLLADDLSLAERGIQREALRDDVKVSGVDTLTDLIMEDGCKPVWM